MDSSNRKEPTILKRDLENEDLAVKLDGKMDIIFEYIASRPPTEQDECFNFTIKAFDKLVIQTHRSHYAQYVIFYICALKPYFVDSFLGYLFTALFTETNAPTVRQACATFIGMCLSFPLKSLSLFCVGFLGSFVARAAYLPSVTVKRVVEQLMPWIHDYLDRNPNQNPDAARHGVFYYVFQALMMIILFRHQHLTELDSQAVRKLELERLIHSNLNPIKMSGSQTIATEFVKVLRQHGVKVSNILQRNKKIILPTKTFAGTDNVIYAFFPFDPYHLTVSGRFIKPMYIVWVQPQDTGSSLAFPLCLEIELKLTFCFFALLRL